ncbi:unnamed protein product [Parnassius mnemosyne]|uniref:Uncharacterized protein n=1 Tax=Parnassius mnemosyne TaxID=213953 RepID=A0AAV1LS33_9NEOP
MSQNTARYREVLCDFINIYRNEPCLWQIKNKLYHSRWFVLIKEKPISLLGLEELYVRQLTLSDQAYPDMKQRKLMIYLVKQSWIT